MITTRRKGFTLIELVMVVAVVGILSIITLPKGRVIIHRNALRSAKQEVAAMLAVARASAMHNGRHTRFVRNGNVVHVRFRQGAQLDTVGAPVDVAGEYGVSLLMSPDSIRFDPRGFATGISGAYQAIRVRRGTLVDSVCVGKFGRIVTEGRCF